MRIIIEVKDTATLAAIEVFDKLLHDCARSEYQPVIKSISKEW